MLVCWRRMSRGKNNGRLTRVWKDEIVGFFTRLCLTMISLANSDRAPRGTELSVNVEILSELNFQCWIFSSWDVGVCVQISSKNRGFPAKISRRQLLMILKSIFFLYSFKDGLLMWTTRASLYCYRVNGSWCVRIWNKVERREKVVWYSNCFSRNLRVGLKTFSTVSL